MRAQQKVVMAFGCAVAAWTPLASFIALHGTGLWRNYGWPSKAWAWWLWLPYAGSNHAVHAWLSRSGVGAAGVLMSVPFFALLRYTKDGTGSAQRPKPVRRGRSDNHGHADWISMRELRRLFPGPDTMHGGIVVGEAYRVDQDTVSRVAFDPRDQHTWGQGGKAPLLIDPCDDGPTHSLIFAGSGGFKTVSAVSTMLHWTGSAVVLDPSCEMGPMLRDARKSMGQRVIELAPATAATVGVNVLDWIDPADPLSDGHVQSVVAWACGEPKRGTTDEAQFFASWGRKLVACLLADMLSDAGLTPEEKTLRALRTAVATPERRIKALLRTIHTDSGSAMARAIAGSLMDMAADETFSGIYANANEMTAWLSVRAYADLVSGSAFRSTDLGGGNMTVFLQLPLESLITAPEVGRVLVGAMLNAIYRRDGDITGRVLFLLDEAARLGRMAILEQARDAGRKYGITLQLCMQSAGQLEAIWGREGRRAWSDSVSWRAYAAIRDLDTAREISELFGHHAVIAKSERSNKWGASTHEIKRRLINPEELLQDTRSDELFIYAGGKPIRCGRAIYFRRPELNARVAVNRFAAQG